MPIPEVDKKKCTGCGTCVDICPMEVFEMKNEKAVVSNDKCVGCNACAAQCPSEAIIIKD
jgi:ferredoxin